MRPASLLLVFALAKCAGLLGHHVPISAWSPIAYLWQDALVALVFAAIEALLGRRAAVAWLTYAVLAGYAAINIPVVRVLSTPLTASMWRAARGALADSIWLYATAANVLLIVAVSAAAALAPFCLRNASRRRVVALLAVCVAAGPAAMTRTETRGLERNAWTALAFSMMPQVTARTGAADWRGQGVDRTPSVDLSVFRGAAAGRNVVLVSLESTAAKYLGLYGAAPDVMPRLSELARTGIVFDNAYAVYPESIKGLFSVLVLDLSVVRQLGGDVCGRSVPVDRSGARRRRLCNGAVPCRPVHVSGHGGHRPEPRLPAARGRGRHRREPRVQLRRRRAVDRRANPRLDRRTSRDQPFFVTYLPIAGHHPYDTPEPGPFPEHDEFGRYRNALHYSDAALGSLIDGLEARGRQQNTLWIVYGDHGEAFGQHDGNFGHTFQLYEENVRVPFLIAAPGLLRRQIRSERIVSLIDTTPTMLDLLGVP